MAYPTTPSSSSPATTSPAPQLNYLPTSPTIGLQPLFATSTVQNHPLGQTAKFQDNGTLGYGEIEAIYLKGVASTAAGDLVAYDPVAKTTTRAVAASRGPLAVAMSANVLANFGWYAIRGNVPVNTTAAGTGAANAFLDVTATAGQATVGGTTAQQGILGAICKTAQDTPTAGFTQVELAYPQATGLTAHA